jgi:hypothetical protein
MRYIWQYVVISCSAGRLLQGLALGHWIESAKMCSLIFCQSCYVAAAHKPWHTLAYGTALSPGSQLKVTPLTRDETAKSALNTAEIIQLCGNIKKSGQRARSYISWNYKDPERGPAAA